MSKYTPGPWVVSHGGTHDTDGFSIASNNAEAKRVRIVCECWPCTIVDNEHLSELAANAALIADAPAMLDLIAKLNRALTRGLDCSDDVQWQAFQEAVDMLQKHGG